jgi:hypothetical protein
MNGNGHPQPYEFHRTQELGSPNSGVASVSDSMEYSEAFSADQESHVAASSVTAGLTSYYDATRTVHEMHLALLFLLSNPDEFHKVAANPPPTLSDWNNEYSDEATADGTVATPLPYVVFADDAEVVLPQAHTASQLFGIERVEGIELEAAAGVPALSQLFLRWLALMPGGDHLNIIDPPGLTVMRIAGGRYRVTAAHRVVWTWMNEFAPLGDSSQDNDDQLQVGDLVTMTIVDVFETDSNGKLLSYCPTFDNRAIHKTTQATEMVRRSSSKLFSSIQQASKSNAAHKMNQAASQLTRVTVAAARHMAESVRHQWQGQTPSKPVDAEEFENALNAAEERASEGQTYLSREDSSSEGGSR